jgi:Phosphoesterase family
MGTTLMQKIAFTSLLAAGAFLPSTYAMSDSKTQSDTNSTPGKLPFKKVLVLFYENQGYTAAMSQPFFKSLTQKGALLTNFFAETHPSQGNYIALVSGGLQGVTGDQNYDLDSQHIGDLLEAKGLTWKNYAEGYPGNCFLGAKSGRYVRKHTPFISFTNVQDNASRCDKIVPATQLAKDIVNGTLPNFSFYSPDLDNDGHDTGIEYADKALQKLLTPLIENEALLKDLLIVVTFDEDDHSEGNRIYTTLIGSGVKPGAKSNNRYDHYSLLKTIEDQFGLDSLGGQDAAATSITGIWASF